MPTFPMDDLERALALGKSLSGLTVHGSAALWLDPRRPYLAVASADRRSGKNGHGPLSSVLASIPSRLIIRDGTSQLDREQLLAPGQERRTRYTLAELLARHEEVRALLRRVLSRLLRRHGHFTVHHVVQTGGAADGLGDLLRSLTPGVTVLQHTVDLEGLNAQGRRELRKQFAQELENSTGPPPDHPPAPGTGPADSVVGRIDRELALVASALDLEGLVTPTNLPAARKAFLADPGNPPPAFEYAPLPVDPDLVRQRLYALPVHDLPPGVLAAQLAARRNELALELELLERRGTAHFRDRACELYGTPDGALVTTALEILQATEDCTTVACDADAAPFNGRALRERLTELSAELGLAEPPTLRIDAPLDRARVAGGELLLARGYRATDAELRALAAGEIGARLLARAQGDAQPLRLASTGFAGARRTVEGLVVAFEHLRGRLMVPRLRQLAARVLCVTEVLDGAPFEDAFRRLRDQHGFPARDAWRICARAYRGGGWIADMLPLAGFLDVLAHFESGGTCELLLAGHWPLSALDDVETLVAGGWLSPLSESVAKKLPRSTDVATTDQATGSGSTSSTLSLASLMRTRLSPSSAATL